MRYSRVQIDIASIGFGFSEQPPRRHPEVHKQQMKRKKIIKNMTQSPKFDNSDNLRFPRTK
jgi:hypothetical protein